VISVAFVCLSRILRLLIVAEFAYVLQAVGIGSCKESGNALVL
jgi:hypothetical protein